MRAACVGSAECVVNVELAVLAQLYRVLCCVIIRFLCDMAVSLVDFLKTVEWPEVTDKMIQDVHEFLLPLGIKVCSYLDLRVGGMGFLCVVRAGGCASEQHFTQRSRVPFWIQSRLERFH